VSKEAMALLNARTRVDPSSLSSSSCGTATSSIACISPLQQLLLPWMQSTPRPPVAMEDIPPRHLPPCHYSPEPPLRFPSYQRVFSRSVPHHIQAQITPRTDALLGPVARRASCSSAPLCIAFLQSTWTYTCTRQVPAKRTRPLLHLLSQRTHVLATENGNLFLLVSSRGRRRVAMDANAQHPHACVDSPSGVRALALLPCLHSRVTTSRHPSSRLPSTPHSHSSPVWGHVQDANAMDFRSNSCVYLGSSSRRAGGGVEGVHVHAARHIRARIPRPVSTTLGPVALRDDVLLVSSPRCTPCPRCACAGDEG
jgi:hypothetical protein